MSVLFIPIRDSREFVSLNFHQLPSDPHDLIDLLKLELAHPDLWLIAAKEYFRRGLTNEFVTILSVISGAEAAEAYRNESFKSSRIAILNTLAAYESARGFASRDPAVKSAAFSASISHLNAASELDLHTSMTWCGKGFLLYFQGEFSNAENNFNNAIQADSAKENVLALMGKALCCVARCQYQDALRCYRQAISMNPSCPPEVRLGFAFCYFKLKQYEKAKNSFLRVLQLEPNNVQANLGLSILELNSLFSRLADPHSPPSESDAAEFRLSISSVFDKIRSAFHSDPTNVGILLLLANHYFYSSEWSKVRILAAKVLESIPTNNSDSNSNSLRCESLFQLGRSYHAQGDLKSALNFYKQAEQFQSAESTNWLLKVCLSQCLIGSGELNSARDILLSVAASQPHDYFVSRLLGSISFRLGDYRDSVAKLLAAMKSPSPVDLSSDPEYLLELAQAQHLAAAEYSSGGGELSQANKGLLREARANYSKSIEILKFAATNSTIPLSISNNFAVCSAQLGEFEESESLYRNAIDDPAILSFIDSESDSTEAESAVSWPALKAELVSLLYNYGLLLESRSRYSSATRLFLLISHFFPSYLDSDLRLAAIKCSTGDSRGAELLFKSAIEKQPNSIAALTELGVFYMKAGNLSESVSNFMKIMKESTKGGNQSAAGDSYAKLCLGNLQFHQGRIAARKAGIFAQSTVSSELKQVQSCLATAAEYFERAGKYYRSVIEKEPNNFSACNGLGLILASEGKFHEAREIFAAVKEGKPEFDDATINLAHMAVSQGQFNQAVKFYSSVLEKVNSKLANSNQQNDRLALDDRKLSLINYIARAHYMAGSMIECQVELQRLIHLRPGNIEYWYNLALSQEEFAIEILQRPKNEKSLNEVREATKQLQSATAIFQRIQNEPQTQKSSPASLDSLPLPLLITKSATHSQFCRLSFEAAQPHLIAAEEREKQFKILNEKSARAREEHEQRLESERLRIAALEEKIQFEAQKVAKEKRERLAEMMATAEWGKSTEEQPMDEEKQDLEDAAADEREEARKRAASKKGNKRKKKSQEYSDESDAEQSEIEAEQNQARQEEIEAAAAEVEEFPIPAAESLDSDGENRPERKKRRTRKIEDEEEETGEAEPAAEEQKQSETNQNEIQQENEETQNSDQIKEDQNGNSASVSAVENNEMDEESQ